MKLQTLFRSNLILWLFLMPTGVRAQEQLTTNAPDSTAVQDLPLVMPVTMNGQGGSLAFASETPMESYLSGGVSVMGAYTDNALLTNNHEIENFSYFVQPHLAWSEITPKLKWSLGVISGFIQNNNLGAQNEASENVILGATRRLTGHVSLRLDEAFSNTSGLFSFVGNQAVSPGIGVAERSNNSLLVPPAQRMLSSQSLAELTDQVGLHKLVGIRSTYWLLDFTNSPPSPEFGPLHSTRAKSVEAFYDWNASERQWLGLTLRGQRFETRPATLETDVASILVYYSLTAAPTLTITFFAGPAYSSTPTTTVAANPGLKSPGRFWTSSEGATLNWAGYRTSANIDFVRQPNDGGGLASPVILQNITARVRRQIGRNRHEAQFGVTDSSSAPLPSGTEIQGLSAFALFQERVTRGFAMQFGYSWERQNLPGTGVHSDANRGWFSVSYDFSHVLGK